MGARGKQVDFFTHLKTEEDFQTKVLNETKDMWVLDVYTEWCGPCTVATNTLQQLKIKYNDANIKFGTAQSDSITYLANYVNRCQPTFMFIAAGQLVDVVRGVKVPTLIKATNTQLENEKKVAAGEAERVVFVDEAAGTPKPAEDEEEPEEEEAPPPARKITVAVIKPDAVAAEKVDEILQKLDEVGIDVLCNEERTLEREEAEQFYEEHRGTDFFLQLIDYMTSGAIVALALAARDPEKDVVAMWRDMIGPKDIAIAKQEAPESLRAKFAGAESGVENALHGSDSADTAARELAFFFPDFHSRMHAKTPAAIKPRLQRTLALIRPDALRKYREDIIGKINAAGFEIASAKEVSLNREQAAEFYKEHAEQEYFEKLVTHMSSGPVMALALCREDAVSGWRDMLGPKNPEEAKETAPDSLRAQFLEDCEDTGINALHGSDSLESAEREVNFFFPKQQTLAVIKPGAGDEEKDMIYNQIRSSGFHIAAQKETTLTREVAEQFYAEHSDKEFFGELTDFMTSGPTMFMVLSREDAVQGIRDMIGPTDPEEAKQSAPESIRAVLGKDQLRNAMHAASNTEKAKAEIMLAFGDELQFDEDGMLVMDSEGNDAEIAGDDKVPTPEAESEAPAAAE